MTAALETMAGYLLAFLIAMGLVWVLDRLVFGIDAPGLFA